MVQLKLPLVTRTPLPRGNPSTVSFDTLPFCIVRVVG